MIIRPPFSDRIPLTTPRPLAFFYKLEYNFLYRYNNYAVCVCCIYVDCTPTPPRVAA